MTTNRLTSFIRWVLTLAFGSDVETQALGGPYRSNVREHAPVYKAAKRRGSVRPCRPLKGPPTIPAKPHWVTSTLSDKDDTALPPDAKRSLVRRKHPHYRIYVPNVIAAMPMAARAQVGAASVLEMPRSRGTRLDWFRHTLYDYSS